MRLISFPSLTCHPSRERQHFPSVSSSRTDLQSDENGRRSRFNGPLQWTRRMARNEEKTFFFSFSFANSIKVEKKKKKEDKRKRWMIKRKKGKINEMEALKGVDCRSWGIYNSPFLCIHTRGCCNYRLTQWLGKGEKTQEEGLKRAQVLPSIRKTNRLRLFSLRRTRVVKTCNKKNFFFPLRGVLVNPLTQK